MNARPAAIVTVGSELVEGLRVDTNTAHIALRLGRHGFAVTEAVSVGDDVGVCSAVLRRLAADHELVIVTGGLGPTHDDITREAASSALGLPLVTDAEIVEILRPFLARHAESDARDQIFTQALVLEGAEVIPATTGTAPGQVVATPGGTLALLPGPPSEMAPMLDVVLERFDTRRAAPRDLGVVGLPESDVQFAAQRALAAFDGVAFTVLARPGDVRALLIDDGAGPDVLDAAAIAVAAEIGDACYSQAGETLAETVLRLARDTATTIAVAESCTGGMVAAALTDIPGSSEVFLGGVVSYSNAAKVALLGVDAGVLAEQGAVSTEVAEQMAIGARTRFGADVAVGITGVAGPGGGTAEKPVGLVIFGVATANGVKTRTTQAVGTPSRAALRARSTATALDLVRRELLKA
jgi:nicotinamide-nucleotide amidase